MTTMEEAAANDNGSECYQICRKNLQDYAIFIKLGRDLSHQSRRLILRNIDSPSSSRDIKMDASGININDFWLAIDCGQCVQLWVKLKDMLFNLLTQFDRSTYTTLKLFNDGGIYKLFVARIYSSSWRWPLLPFNSKPECRQLQSCSSLTFENSTYDMVQKSSRSSLPLSSTEYDRHARNPISSLENNKVKSSLKRKRGKAEKTINLEDVRSLFSSSLMDAARILRVSRSTLKRRCRQLGITEWPSTKNNKRSRRMSSGNQVSEFASEPQDPHQRLISSDQVSHQEVGNIHKAYQSSSRKHQSLRLLPDKSWPQNESNFSCKRMRTSVQMQSDLLRNKMDAELVREIPKSSHHFCDSAPTLVEAAPSHVEGQKGMTIIVKATYKEDMIRFQFPLKSTVTGLKKEVQRRLNLKAGTFKLKYWDDDDEWALLTFDSDWQDCICISMSNKCVTRLLVQDV